MHGRKRYFAAFLHFDLVRQRDLSRCLKARCPTGRIGAGDSLVHPIIDDFTSAFDYYSTFLPIITLYLFLTLIYHSVNQYSSS